MKKIPLLLILIAITALPASAQTSLMGVTVGTSTLKSPATYTDDIPDGFGFDAATSYGLKAKFNLLVVPVALTVQVNYSEFSSNENDIEYKQNLFIFGLGLEHYFPIDPEVVNPYLAWDVFYSEFGDFEASTNVYDAPSDGGARMGTGIGIGLEFIIPIGIILDASAKYNFNNLIGKEDSEGNIDTRNLAVSVLFSI